MKAPQRFNTPFKRICFLALIAGAITLVVSLTIWTQQSRYNKVYYSKDHFKWLPVDHGFGGRMERKWEWDYDCVRPEAQNRITELKEKLEHHRSARPEQPKPNFRSGRPLKETLHQLKQNRAYSDWFSKETSLKATLDVASRNLSGLSYRGFREGEIKQASRFTLSSPSFSFLGTPTKKDSRTNEEKFRDTLYSKLGLTGFPATERDTIFEKCVQVTSVGYKHIRTSYHTELDDWPDDHPLPFLLGLLLVVGGFMGSYGHKVSFWAVRGTAGRLVSWVKTGSGAAQGTTEGLVPLVQTGDTYPHDDTSDDTTLSSAETDDTQPELIDETSEPPVEVSKSGASRFLPHILIFGGLAAFFGLGVAVNDTAIARFFGRAVASAVDPVNLIIAAILGFAIRRHLVLILSLAALGVGLVVIVAQMNASWGARLTPEGISAKIAAALAVGYLANLIRIIFKKEPDQKEEHHDDDKPASE